MNIGLLKEYVNDFKKDILDSGFKRDLDDYVASLPSSQNNIIALRDIAEKVLSELDRLCCGDLPDALNILLPKKQFRPFTESRFNIALRELIENNEIQQQNFFNQLSQILTQTQQSIQRNIAEINKVELFIEPYLSEDIKRVTKDQLATISIVFKEAHTISSLKKFTTTLIAWNRMLPIYHQLIKSESPQDIQIVEIQNGSIDFVVNINVDIALNLVDLFKVGFQVFGSYLAYKKMLQPIIASYYGNKKLIEQEIEREKLLLDNIGIAIHKKILLQHKKAKKKDKTIDGTAIDKKIEQVTNLVFSHIVKGNDFKLLAMPEPKVNKGEEDHDIFSEKKNALQKISMKARRQLKEIPTDDRVKLLEMYGTIKDVNG